MRKCAVLGIALLAVLSLTLPAQASAQSVFLGAGATIPTGDYKDFGSGHGANTGWMVEGGAGFPVGENGLHLFANGLYGSNGHDHEGEKTNLLGGFGGVEYVFAEPGEAGLFVFGEVGFLQHKWVYEGGDESSSGIAFGGGAGYSLPLGSVNGWVLGRYLQGQTGDDEFDEGNTTFLGLMAGVSIPIGGNAG